MPGAEKLIEKILSDAQRDAEAAWADVEAKKQALRDKTLREIERRKEIERMAKRPSRRTKSAWPLFTT